MPMQDESSIPQPAGSMDAEPGVIEVEEWAARERQRRELWLSGPTETEKALWAKREYERRVAELEGRHWPPRLRGDPTRTMQHYTRELQLATEGAMNLLFKVSLSDALEDLVRAGREWEEEFTGQLPRRRRVALEIDPTEPETAHKGAGVPAPPEGQASSS